MIQNDSTESTNTVAEIGAASPVPCLQSEEFADHNGVFRVMPLQIHVLHLFHEQLLLTKVRGEDSDELVQ